MLPLILRNTSAFRLWRRSSTSGDWRPLLLELPLRLLQQPGSDLPLQTLLPVLAGHLQARHLCLLLPAASAAGWQRLGTQELGDCPLHAACDALPMPGETLRCEACLQAGRHRQVCAMPVEEGRVALLVAEFAQVPGAGLLRELQGAARQLAEVLRTFAEDRQLRRRELAAERAVLARELHDSVAQQLGYLQIRASRLQSVLADPAQKNVADEMLVDLRDTLQGLHRQVRELITTARLTMDGRTLRQALEASVDEFARRSGCVFTLDNRVPGDCLPGEVELQILQIVREALANVVRHSHARQARIDLRQTPGRGIEVQVRDDGVGIPEALPEHGHFGLRIMRERAAAIGADLRIGPQSPHGTSVHLRWGPP